MAQADPISTATDERMSRGGSTKSTSLRSVHTEPAAALGGNPNHLLQWEELDSRTDRLEKAFAALHRYVTPALSDTAQQIPDCGLNRKLFLDLQSDAVAVVRYAPEELRNHHKNWKVS
jgi:hypothetical protein